MVRLGRCTDMTEVGHSVAQSSAVGEWSASGALSGNFHVEIPAGASCGGSGTSGGVSICTLRFNGCGRVSINVTGQGNGGGASTLARVRHIVGGVGTNVLDLTDDSGGTSCDPVGLTVSAGTNPIGINVACGHIITLSFGNTTIGGANGHVTADFDVTVETA